MGMSQVREKANKCTVQQKQGNEQEIGSQKSLGAGQRRQGNEADVMSQLKRIDPRIAVEVQE